MEELKQILEQVKEIEIKTNKLIGGNITGNYKSAFKGKGIEIANIREYVYGDDLKSIEINSTRKHYKKLFIKEFKEERDLHIYFILDVSGSFTLGDKSKTAINLIASIMYTAAKNNDAVGLFLVSDKIEKEFKAKKGKKYVRNLLIKLLSFNYDKKLNTNINSALISIKSKLNRRCVLFVISDFISQDSSQALRILKNKNEVIPVWIKDKITYKIFESDVVYLEDPESNSEIKFDSSNINALLEYIDKNEILIQDNMRKIGVKPLTFFADEDYGKVLINFFRGKIAKYR